MAAFDPKQTFGERAIPTVLVTLVGITVLCGCVGTFGPGDHLAYYDPVQIGRIPATCPITVRATGTPVGFTVTPQEAVELASKEGLAKCNSVFEQTVYADSVNYYIIKAAFGPMSAEADAVVVDGNSGRVTVRKRQP